MCPRLGKQRLIALKCARSALTYPYSMRLLLVSANRERLPSRVLPVGLLTVASAARARHEVSLVDLCFEPELEPALADAIDRFRPDVVGLGLRNLHTNNYDGTEQLLAGYEAIGRAVVMPLRISWAKAWRFWKRSWSRSYISTGPAAT